MNTPFVPTARNSERWHRPEHGAANKYIPGASMVRQKEDRQDRLRKSKALRHATRMTQHLELYRDGTPFQCGVLRLLEQLLGVREAENAEVLYARDRHMAGLIEGAHAFGAISLRQMHDLAQLRDNAFHRRLKELEQ